MTRVLVLLFEKQRKKKDNILYTLRFLDKQENKCYIIRNDKKEVAFMKIFDMHVHAKNTPPAPERLLSDLEKAGDRKSVV